MKRHPRRLTAARAFPPKKSPPADALGARLRCLAIAILARIALLSGWAKQPWSGNEEE